MFGRKIVMLSVIFLFAAGSALCGAAPSLNFLVASRSKSKSFTFVYYPLTRVLALQGIGAGGIASLTQIIIADLVPLRERGSFNGLIAM